jgi:ATP-dependent 26S proteasome regulatory subunit
MIETEFLNLLTVYRAVHFSFPVIERDAAFSIVAKVAFELGVAVAPLKISPNTQTPVNLPQGIHWLENVPALLAQLRGWESQCLQSQLIELVSRCSRSPNQYLVLFDSQEQALPSYLEGLFPHLTMPLPGVAEIQQLMQQAGIAQTDDRLALSVSGLSAQEISLGLQLVQKKGGTLVGSLLAYKRERLKSWGLEFLPSPEIQSFGGLARLKQAIDRVSIDYSQKAKDYHLPLPKGWLLVGPPGTGKTFAAKVCAAHLGFPLISVGVDLVKSRGSAYLKQLLGRIEAASPAVCYFDEFDKFFSASSQSGEDSQSKEVLAVLLTWLSEKTTKTFVIATLNRLDALPPELTRVGRFDKIYYVGFPSAIERKEILQLHSTRFDPRYGLGDGPLTTRDWRILLGRTQNCTGAELKWIVETAARLQFYQGVTLLRLSLDDFLNARSQITPLYHRDSERLLAMENRARFFAEPASEPDTSEYAPVSFSLWGDSEPIRRAHPEEVPFEK